MRFSHFARHCRRTAALLPILMIASTNAHAISDRDLDRFKVIAGGWHLERQCNHLGAQQRADLGDISANAEILTAREIGSEEVREIVASARQFGEEQGTQCGDATAEAVQLSLNVAYEYADAHAERTEETASSERSEQRDTAIAEEPAETPGADLLGRFGSQTEAYYLQRRCGHLAYADDLRFWQLIAHQHQAMLNRFGSSAISQMQRSAEARANSAQLSCGSQTRRMVRSGYASIAQDLSTN